jgi:plasmid maintenance system killer protein
MSETEIIIIYTPVFLKQVKKCDPDLKTEVTEKVSMFKDKDNHQRLKVHKLKGKLKGLYSFSVTHSHRIVFSWEGSTTAVFFSFGSHDVYN